jgi:hypothetical protein
MVDILETPRPAQGYSESQDFVTSHLIALTFFANQNSRRKSYELDYSYFDSLTISLHHSDHTEKQMTNISIQVTVFSKMEIFSGCANEIIVFGVDS